MLEKGADNYNKAMIMATEGGHKSVVRLMFDKGANDYNSTSLAALRGLIWERRN